MRTCVNLSVSHDATRKSVRSIIRDAGSGRGVEPEILTSGRSGTAGADKGWRSKCRLKRRARKPVAGKE